MGVGSDKDRIMVTMSKELKAWYVDRAKEYGMPVSSLAVMALAQYKEQQEGVKALNSIDAYFRGIQEGNATK